MAMQFAKAAKLPKDNLVQAVIQQQKLKQQQEAQEQAAKQGNLSAASTMAVGAPEGSFGQIGTDVKGAFGGNPNATTSADRMGWSQSQPVPATDVPMRSATPAPTSPASQPIQQIPTQMKAGSLPSPSAGMENAGSLMDQQILSDMLGGGADAATLASDVTGAAEAAGTVAETAEGAGTVLKAAEGAKAASDAAQVGGAIAEGASAAAGGLGSMGSGLMASMASNPLGWAALAAGALGLFG